MDRSSYSLSMDSVNMVKKALEQKSVMEELYQIENFIYLM